MNISRDKVYSLIVNTLNKFNRKLLSLVLFGSYVRSPRKAEDIDLLVIIDRIENVHEKFEIEKELSLNLIKELQMPFEVVVLDFNNFIENLKEGTFISGLVLGYKILYDEISIEKYIKELCKKLIENLDYEFIKHGKRYRLSIFAKILLNGKFS